MRHKACCYLIEKNALVADVTKARKAGGSMTGLAPILGVLNISHIIQIFGPDKSSSILQLIKSKSRDLQKLLEAFNGIATLVLSFSALVMIFIL